MDEAPEHLRDGAALSLFQSRFDSRQCRSLPSVALRTHRHERHAGTNMVRTRQHERFRIGHTSRLGP
jgi:hypothetical protein